MNGLTGIGLVIKGVRGAIGRSTSRRARHRKSQMRAVGKGSFKGKSARFGL